MLTQIHYLLRSRQDGRYLSARPDGETNYLLTFGEDHAAYSYLTTHAGEFQDRFSVESVSLMQLQSILQRWGFAGVARVEDPLLPKIQFLGFR